MICAIMQPMYLPWIGYFDLIDRADKFVFLDDVKLEKSTWQVRNRIKSANGVFPLTVTISTPKGRMETTILDTQLEKSGRWKIKHLKSLEMNYKKAPFFKEVYPLFESLIAPELITLSELNILTIKFFSKKMGIQTAFFTSSKMGDLAGVKDTRLVSICKKLNCEEYISPQGSADYLEKEQPGGKIVEEGIKLYYQNFEHPSYAQLYGNFESHLSIIDCLMNIGFEEAINTIRRGRQKKYDYLEFRKEILKI